MCLLLLLVYLRASTGDEHGRAAREAPPVPRAAHRVAAVPPATTPEGTTATARALEGTGSRALCLIEFFWCQ
jgi:hypothetical protein